MTTIPRLPPATSSIDITFTVNETLRPYLTEFYQATKLDGETPDQFVLRLLKNSAKGWYAQKEYELAEEIARDSVTVSIEELRLDRRTFIQE